MGIKIWVDDLRPSPDGYEHCFSVNSAIVEIEHWEKEQEDLMKKATSCLNNHMLQDYHNIIEMINRREIVLIDMDHDAGDYAKDGGDYIKLLDWLEETGRNYPIRIHSMNPVGVANMRQIIERNGWKEVF